MQLNTWYTFEDDDHSYGYTLFYPLRLESPKYGSESYYGIYLHCNDAGPSHASIPGAWIDTGFGKLENSLEDSANEYYDKSGKQPPTPRQLIEYTFTNKMYFTSLMRDEGWVR